MPKLLARAVPTLRRWRRVAVLALAAAAGLLVGQTQAGVPVERLLQDWRFAIRDRPASGQITLVEIDARSIAAIDHWPWPRRNYAPLVDRLHRAGAAAIAFDIDSSSRSSPADDRAFAAALDRAGGGVALPTLRQAAGGGTTGYLDALPIPELRAHSMAAAVSVLPDDDGAVRTAPVGIVTGGLPRPSLSAMLAGQGGAVGQLFPIDYAINPATIPRKSFIDIRDGHFDPASIAGKRVLIGATAVEMGDRYGAPRFGVIPGVVIQALAAETLMRGLPVDAGWLPALLLGLALAPLALGARRQGAFVAAVLLPPLILFGVGILAAQGGWALELVPGLAATSVASGAALAMRIGAELNRRRVVDEATGLLNRNALVALPDRDAGSIIIATARVADYDKLLAALGAGSAGDLVRRVAERIGILVGGTIYRVDDRVLAWREIVDIDQSKTRADQVRAMMLQPVEVAGRRVDVTLAIGVAEGSEPASALANAALAAAQARADGTGWHVHAQAEADSNDREVSLLGELDAAIANGEIEVAYQPKLHIASGRIGGVEALVRWRHPVRGYMPPDLFVPLAERGDRIAGLTLHVLEQTLADLRGWDRQGAPIGAAVNISAKLLNAPAFLEQAAAAIARGGIDPHRLTLEVTESATMSDPAGAARALAALKALGVSISMDDYGTGQSTLTYLRQLPLDELKLDRSFVQFAHQNRSDGVLVRSTVELAHELGLKVVAEGVEDEECLDYLRRVGCDMAQGYLISRPTTAAAIVGLVVERRAAA